jgi:hypothetical protein
MIKLGLAAALTLLCLVPEVLKANTSKALTFPAALTFPVSYSAPAAGHNSTFNVNPPYQEPINVKVYVDGRLMYTYEVTASDPGIYAFPYNSSGKGYKIEATPNGGSMEVQSGTIV